MGLEYGTNLRPETPLKGPLYLKIRALLFSFVGYTRLLQGADGHDLKSLNIGYPSGRLSPRKAFNKTNKQVRTLVGGTNVTTKYVSTKENSSSLCYQLRGRP